MNILVIGGGGREHAICDALKRSAMQPTIFCAPGNAGIVGVAECVQLDGFSEIVDFCQEKAIEMVVVGPEQPLVEGLTDQLRARKILVVGPSQDAAQLEASKHFTKEICKKHGIPTAESMTFDEAQGAISYVQAQGAPIVVKADGLAAGKGVTVATTVAQAVAAIEDCFSGRFGEAGARVVIEECLEGEEISFFALCDGEHAIELGSAQDHKRVGDGDTGPNTGGMGTYSPAPIADDALRQRVMDEIIWPTVKGMKADGIPYQGVLFAGLMITADGPKLIEFNCRLGDPEAQVILPRLKGDFVQLCLQVAKGELDKASVELSDQSALCVVMAANGYPGGYEKGSVIEGVDKATAMDGAAVFHAGTRRGRNCGKLKANGGRVLGVTALGDDLPTARKRAYEAVEAINWPEGFYRHDIGWRALS